MTRNSRILILDDEFLVLMDLKGALQQRGFSNFETASNTAGAMAIVANGDVDVAFLDVNLGAETSYSVASMLKERDIPFAFVTGYGEGAIEAEFDAAPVLTKPINAWDIDRFLQLALGPSR